MLTSLRTNISLLSFAALTLGTAFLLVHRASGDNGCVTYAHLMACDLCTPVLCGDFSSQQNCVRGRQTDLYANRFTCYPFFPPGIVDCEPILDGNNVVKTEICCRHYHCVWDDRAKRCHKANEIEPPTRAPVYQTVDCVTRQPITGH